MRSPRVAAQVHDVVVLSTEPRLASVEGVDIRSLNRAVWMLDTALVADAVLAANGRTPTKRLGAPPARDEQQGQR